MNSTFKTILHFFFLAGTLFWMQGWKNEDPVPENIPELITKVILEFAPAGGGPLITVTATDPDGGGVQDIIVDGPINLLKDSEYTMTLELLNELYLPGDEDYNVTEAIKNEGEEHQFFFSFSEGTFASPEGTGNILSDMSSVPGSINYLDKDSSGQPLGIQTSWTTSGSVSNSKSFRIILKHQPELKSSTSTSLDGESDLDVSFILNVN